MAIWTVREINGAISDLLIQSPNEKWLDTEINTVHFDNRRLDNNGLFIAKEGENTDGHLFIKNTLEKGVENFAIAERLPEDLTEEQEGRVFLVSDSIKAFELLGLYSRERIGENGAKVIGITGSVGKTTTKDLAFDVFSALGKTYTNPMSFNSYFGILNTLCNMPRDVEYFVIEMGMNHHGEMEEITKILRPDLITVLNIKLAHSEYFKDEQDIAKAKSEIFLGMSEDGIALLNKDDSQFDYIKNKALEAGLKEENILSFGVSDSSDLFVKLLSAEVSDNFNRATFKVKDEECEFLFNNLDKNLLINFLPLLGFVKTLNLDIDKIKRVTENFKVPRGRNNIEYATFKNNQGKDVSVTIINGSYNAVNPDVFVAGLKLMNDVCKTKECKRRIAIFGDILEAGENTERLHLSLRDEVVKYKIDKLCTVGNIMNILQDAVPQNIQGRHFANSKEVVSEIKDILQDGDIVFIKGSKGIKTWYIVDELTGYKTDIFV